MSTLNLLAFDLGASSGRALLGRFDGQRIAVRTVHQFANGPVELAGHLYWPLPRLVSELRRGIAAAARETDGSLDAIGIDTWGVDFGLLDADGDLLGNPVHYRDSRTRGMFEAAFERMPKEEIFRHTGLAFQPFNTLYQLLALKLAKPAMLEAASSLLFMPDLLGYFLTGERATEYTDASTSQLLDAQLRTWSEPVIEAMGFPAEVFTSIEEPGRIRGIITQSIQDELQLGPVPVVAVASHDTASAVVAMPSRRGCLSQQWNMVAPWPGARHTGALPRCLEVEPHQRGRVWKDHPVAAQRHGPLDRPGMQAPLGC